MKTESNAGRKNRPGRPSRWRRPGIVLVKILVLLGVAILVGGLALINLNGSLCANPKTAAQIFVTQSVQQPLFNYRRDTGSFPTTAQGLPALLVAPPGVTGWKGPYLTTTSTPLDPWKQPYQYAYPSTHGQIPGQYDVWSLGPVNVLGVHNLIGNWMNLL